MGTLVVTFAFASNQESFTANAGAQSTLTWQSGAGNPAGCLQSALTGSNRNNNNSWTRALTYQTMGVPSGSTITGITSASAQSKCTAFTGGTACTSGAVTLVDGATTVTLSSQRAFSATDANFVTTNGVDSTGLSKPSSNSVTITIPNHLQTTSGGSGKGVTLQQDQVTFTITYTTTFSESLSETATASDTWTSLGIFGGTVTEIASASDTWTNIGSFSHTISETSTATDSINGVITYLAALSESVTASDTDAAALTLSGAISESISASDSTSTTLTRVGSISESVTTTDSSDATSTYSKTISESITISDELSATVDSVPPPEQEVFGSRRNREEPKIKVPKTVKVKSSNLSTVKFDQRSNELQVKFKSGPTYSYTNVDSKTYRGLVKAKSAGSYLHNRVIGSHFAVRTKNK